jgi:hypothetical protein
VDGVDLYSLYAKQYGLDVEDESANFIPLCSDEREIPMLLQITRWHDHLWEYLKTDRDNDSGEEKDHDTDEEDEKRGDQDEDNDEDDGDHSDNDNVDSSYKYGQTTWHVTAKDDASDSESDNQMGRKRRRRSLVPITSSKRHRGLDGSDSGRKLAPDGSDPDSEDTESEEACVGRKRNRPNKQSSIQSGKRRRVLVNKETDSETDAIYSSGGKNLGLDDSDFSDFSEASDDDDSGNDSEDEGEEEWMDEDVEKMRAGGRVSKRDQRRWAKWGTLTSVSKAKTLFSIHLAGTTKKEQTRWHGKKLRETVLCYMEMVRKKVIRGDLEIRHVLAG